MGTLFMGDEDRHSAKKRRQEAYSQDLQLQMREREAAKMRERYQGMNVNASGWLDPEKRPERLKPLGGSGFMTDRGTRDQRVRPYHTLFEYGQTEATAGNAGRPMDSVNQAYNLYAAREIDRPHGYGSIVQPLVVPYVDNRPIIMPGRSDSGPSYQPKFNPFEHNESIHSDIRNLLSLSQIERDRAKAQLAKEHDEYLRQMKRELEAERRRLMEQENDARRRMEEMRREMEERRREYERQRLEAERARREKEKEPKPKPEVARPQSASILGDMHETRRRLIEERKKIEELLKALLNQPDYKQVKILKRPPPPPTPVPTDWANRNVLEEFNYLKHKDIDSRKNFRSLYPDIPETNLKLEAQQRALLRQQEETLRNMERDDGYKTTTKQVTFRRPDWMNKTPTPLPHRLRYRDRLWTTQSWDGDVDRRYNNAVRKERMLDEYDALKLSYQRPLSAETQVDDSWIRPASAHVV